MTAIASLFPPPTLCSTTQLSQFSRERFLGFSRKSLVDKKERKNPMSTNYSLSIICGILPVDPWAPTIDSQSIASQLFAASLFPYIGFLYFITKSNSSPKLTLFGFYFLLAFVGATIPAGIYAKLHYGTSLSNVDWLHGSAESLLTLTNLFIVLGLRGALRKSKDGKKCTESVLQSDVKEEKQTTL
ncbi:hypothetical protein AMTRI_Chr01g108210 [Amborella trichopoda]|uniref:uncharacterized protein LOC105420873 n=1 Tax=Amborella trichopoda TaxID=13333 RepID=UPI0005D434F4|nr:uncharacterized protein LOC105420873 [Amborella trichopoda]XP_011624442.1 uncharacterized protein LOC105420873 [Amborella trichopoda]XP_020524634.1 uncharacterized protein LOC105420873 [Amborella trichopoda]XP_020524635.1 uncharacterized protein LOC105420873 [Amborella trichopoda]|eukprot:XP_011624441.1 uncharacterized protein LOC105420873 [Amborella trichopoda]